MQMIIPFEIHLPGLERQYQTFTWFIDIVVGPHPKKVSVYDVHDLKLDDTIKMSTQSNVVLLDINIHDVYTLCC